MSMDVLKKCMWIKNGCRIHGYSMSLEYIYILDIYIKTYMEKEHRYTTYFSCIHS